MPLPVEHKAFQEVGPAQKRAVGRCRTADHHMVAAAGAGVAAIDHELVAAQARVERILVKPFRDRDGLRPCGGRLHVDLDHARIRRDLDDLDARIVGRGIAFDVNGLACGFRGGLDGGEKIKVVFQLLDRRHEHARYAIAHFDADGGSDACRLKILLDTGLALHIAFARGNEAEARRVLRRLATHGFQAVVRVGDRQWRAGLQRVLRVDMRIGGGRHPGQRAKR